MAPTVEKERLINRFARVTQFLTWPILFPLFHLCFDLRVEGRANFAAVGSPFIVISNHVSFYDSFLFRLALGAWTPHLPLRFMAVHSFDWKFLNFLDSVGIIDFIYALFGVFVITLGQGIEKNLEEAREIIHAGGNVVIYPEGSIVKGGGVGTFHKGAAVLMRQTGVALMPLSFRLAAGRSWFRKKLRVNIGGPMNILPGMTDEEVTASFRRTITDLYEKM